MVRFRLPFDMLQRSLQERDSQMASPALHKLHTCARLVRLESEARTRSPLRLTQLMEHQQLCTNQYKSEDSDRCTGNRMRSPWRTLASDSQPAHDFVMA